MGRSFADLDSMSTIRHTSSVFSRIEDVRQKLSLLSSFSYMLQLAKRNYVVSVGNIFPTTKTLRNHSYSYPVALLRSLSELLTGF